MNELVSEREQEWRTALIELMDFYEVQGLHRDTELARLRGELDQIQSANGSLRHELESALARAVDLDARVIELRNPARHLVRAVGRRLRRQS